MQTYLFLFKFYKHLQTNRKKINKQMYYRVLNTFIFFSFVFFYYFKLKYIFIYLEMNHEMNNLIRLFKL
jgi:hypothetical protein